MSAFQESKMVVQPVDKRRKTLETMIASFKERTEARKAKKATGEFIPQPAYQHHEHIVKQPSLVDVNYESDIPSRSCFVASETTSTEHSESVSYNYPTATSSISYQVEFDRNHIQQVEIEQNPEFFEERTTKTPERYMYIRNSIVDLWNRDRPKYVSKTMARQQIKDCGDVNCVGRIHSFLERMQWINSGKVIGKYIRTTPRLKPQEQPPPRDNTHVIFCAPGLLVLDMHCRLIENPVGLIVGKQVTPLLFVIEDIVPIGVGKCDLPEDTRVIGLYYESNHFPNYLEASYPFWILRLVWRRQSCTYNIIRKDKQQEVGVVEVVRREDIRNAFQTSAVFNSILNAYLNKAILGI